MSVEQEIINPEKISDILSETKNPTSRIVTTILDKAKEKKGLELEEAGFLINIDDPILQQQLFETAHYIKDQIYGERLVFFAPLYISDFCVNDCEYCNFHIRNNELERKKLTLNEIEQQVRYLVNMGHKRLLLEFGEDPVNNNIDYIVETINKIYSIKTEKGNVRRINVNIASTAVENYRKLKQAKIGTYQLFQETYHRQTYEKLHCGPKADYDRQITAHNRAFEAGLDDLGLGVLFGLYDWRFEVLALVSHAQYLNKKYNVGPHTISVPRFRPALTVTYQPEFPVSDSDFLKLIAILRLAVPYTGMIISTREKPEIRKVAFKIGISQTSAASVTIVGGYGKKIPLLSHFIKGGKRGISHFFKVGVKDGKKDREPQFKIYDERSLQDVISAVLDDNLLPSFCTACYRSGRTGEHFMELSKPGEIHNFCRPNGLLTFAEYLEDFANYSGNGLYQKGYKVIDFYLNQIENEIIRDKTIERLNRIKQGERDIYF